MNKLQKLIDSAREQAKSTSGSPQSRRIFDDQLIKASVKARDERRLLLISGKTKAGQRRIKRTESRERNRVDLGGHNQTDFSYDMHKLSLPINSIPMQEKYIESDSGTPLEMLSKYPNLHRYVTSKYQKEEEPTLEESTFQMRRNRKLKYGVEYEPFIKMLPSEESRLRVQQIYDKYTKFKYKRVNKSLYENIPPIDQEREQYKKLVHTQTRILNQDLKLSNQNQLKLQQNLKEIYQIIRKN